jgi:hypothetical protein
MQQILSGKLMSYVKVLLIRDIGKQYMILICVGYYCVQSFKKELQGFGHHTEGQGNLRKWACPI